jgi:GNAT superfamily N-acetyltransferase
MATLSSVLFRPKARPRGVRGGIDSRIAESLERIARALPDGVTLRTTFAEGRIDLDLIKVEQDARGQGLARTAMERLLALADRWSLPVRLQAISLADPGTGPDEEALLGWYRRLGFDDTGDRSVTGLTIMLRHPTADCPCVTGSGHLHQSHRHLAGLSGRTPPRHEGRSFALPKHR